MEERNATRREFVTSAQIARPNGHFHPVQTRDISLAGLYAYTRDPFEVGDTCEVRVSLIKDVDVALITLRGTVVRKDADGIGIHFGEVDAFSFRHLDGLMQADDDTANDGSSTFP